MIKCIEDTTTCLKTDHSIEEHPIVVNLITNGKQQQQQQSKGTRRSSRYYFGLSVHLLLINLLTCRAFTPPHNIQRFRSTTTSNNNNYHHHPTISKPSSYHQNKNNPIITKSQNPPSSSSSLHPFQGINLDDLLMSAQSSGANLATTVLSSSSGPSPSSLLLLYIAGLLTSISPCTFGMLPLTISYISTAAGERSDKTAFLPTVAFAAGLASVFCGLGLSVGLLGGVFGQTTTGEGDDVVGGLVLAVMSGGVSVAMGLQLLSLVKLPLPSLDLLSPDQLENSGGANDGEKNDDVAILFRTFLLGGSSALVASPCSTPVLTSILAYVATSRDPSVGAGLLFTYTLGYATPLLAISATGGQALAKLRALAFSRNDDSLVTIVGNAVQPLSAGVLIWYGTDSLLRGFFGDPSLAGLAPIIQ